VKGLFPPHYVSWSEQQRIEAAAPSYLGNVVRIITETGLRIYKELTPMKKDDVDLENKVVWIPDSKTPNGVAEVPLTDLAVEAIRDQTRLAGNSSYLFPRENSVGHQTTFKTAWRATLRRAKVPYFRIYDLRSTYATRLSGGGVADEGVTQLLRQGDAKVFKKYSQMKLQMSARRCRSSIARPTSPLGFWDRRDDEPEFWDSSATIFARKAKHANGRAEGNRSRIKDLQSRGVAQPVSASAFPAGYSSAMRLTLVDLRGRRGAKAQRTLR
jgi:hypothetical protein